MFFSFASNFKKLRNTHNNKLHNEGNANLCMGTLKHESKCTSMQRYIRNVNLAHVNACLLSVEFSFMYIYV